MQLAYNSKQICPSNKNLTLDLFSTCTYMHKCILVNANRKSSKLQKMVRKFLDQEIFWMKKMLLVKKNWGKKSVKKIWFHTLLQLTLLQLKGRVWERNKCVLKDAKICPDYAAIIFFSEKFIF